jgi:hypothetical protein
MPRCEFHPSLVEQATFLAARRDYATERILRADLDKVYRDVEPDERDGCITQVYGRWFVELRLDEPIRVCIAERPVIGQRVGCCHVGEAAGRRRENVELFVRANPSKGVEAVRTLTIDLCPESLVEPDRLTPWLRRELLKVSDMLDDAFGYSPILPKAHRARQNLIRDRYAVLWDAYVEARLKNAADAAGGPSRNLRERFERAFAVDGTRASATLLSLMPQLASVTHDRLLEWALTPTSMPGWQAVEKDFVPGRGELCLLCGFPTYDWFDFGVGADADVRAGVDAGSSAGKGAGAGASGGAGTNALVRTRIARARPDWRLEDGACRQCVETFAAMQD